MAKAALAVSVRCDDRSIDVVLDDGTVAQMLLPQFLAGATSSQRRNCKVTAFGTAIEWPALDEVMGVNVILGVHEDVVAARAGARPGIPRS